MLTPLVMLILAAGPPIYKVNGTASCSAPNASGVSTCTWEGYASIPDDAGVPDAGGKDAGTPDAGRPDSGPDAGLPDYGPPAPGPGGIYDPVAPLATLPAGLVFTRPTMAEPVVGVPYVDPTFGTTVRRVLLNGMHEYAQLETFSADDSHAIFTDVGKGQGVYQYPSMVLVKRFGTDWYSTRWLGTTGHKLVYVMGTPVRVHSYDLDTKVDTEVLKTAWSYAYTSQTYEEASYDGKYIALWVHNDTGPAFMVAVDLVGKKLMPWQIDHAALYDSGICTPDPQWGKVAPDWMRASPSGKYFMIQWAKTGSGRCQGLELWDMQTGAWVRQVHQHSQHSDIAMTPDGREFCSSVVTAAPLNNGYPALVHEWLDGTPQTVTRMVAWRTTDHFSCIGNRGICVVDAVYEQLPEFKSDRVFAGQVWLYDLKGNGTHIGWHGSNSSTYWAQPSCSISRSGKRVACNTDWGVAGKTFPIVIELP